MKPVNHKLLMDMMKSIKIPILTGETSVILIMMEMSPSVKWLLVSKILKMLGEKKTVHSMDLLSHNVLNVQNNIVMNGKIVSIWSEKPKISGKLMNITLINTLILEILMVLYLMKSKEWLNNVISMIMED